MLQEYLSQKFLMQRSGEHRCRAPAQEVEGGEADGEVGVEPAGVAHFGFGPRWVGPKTSRHRGASF